MNDILIKTVAEDKCVRAYGIRTTNLVNEAVQIHKCSPVASAALGRMLSAGAMMGGMLKGEEDKLTLQIKGGGPLGTVLVTANAKSEVRGYCDNPFADVPKKPNGKLDVGAAVGRNGYLSVIRDIGMKEPYIGQTPIVTGEIGDDITYYYAASEQQPSAVALGVLVDRDHSIRAAGGFIISLLPGADEETVALIENSLREITSVTDLIASGLDPLAILQKAMPSVRLDVLSESEPVWKCNCSIERMERALLSIGKKEIEDILREQGEAELVCHFCNSKYQISKERLQELLENANISENKRK